VAVLISAFAQRGVVVVRAANGFHIRSARQGRHRRPAVNERDASRMWHACRSGRSPRSGRSFARASMDPDRDTEKISLDTTPRK